MAHTFASVEELSSELLESKKVADAEQFEQLFAKLGINQAIIENLVKEEYTVSDLPKMDLNTRQKFFKPHANLARLNAEYPLPSNKRPKMNKSSDDDDDDGANDHMELDAAKHEQRKALFFAKILNLPEGSALGNPKCFKCGACNKVLKLGRAYKPDNALRHLEKCLTKKPKASEVEQA